MLSTIINEQVAVEEVYSDDYAEFLEAVKVEEEIDDEYMQFMQTMNRY